MTVTTTANGWTSYAQDRAWPTTWDQRRREYKRRRMAYVGGEYALADFERLGLFQATKGGTIIHKTRRICTLLSFVANVDTAALSGGLALNLRRDAFEEETQTTPHGVAIEVPSARADAALSRGVEVWRRSDIDAKAETWARSLAVCGDWHIEAALDEEGKAIVYMVEPEHVEIEYDRYRIGLSEACVEMKYRVGEDEVCYKREIDAKTITTTEDGKAIEGAAPTVPNPTGVVTLLHVPFSPVPGMCSDGPVFSANAFQGLDEAVGFVDSVRTALSVVGSRNASPVMVATGVDAGGMSASEIDRMVAIPSGATIEMLTPDLQGLDALAGMADGVFESTIKLVPELLFADASAASSGTALSYRAGAFAQKIEPVRKRFFRAIAKAIGIALALEDKKPFDDTYDVFEVSAAPALPTDKAAYVNLVSGMVTDGLLKRSDAIQALQGIGIIPPEAHPLEYAAEAAAEQRAETEWQAQQAGAILGTQQIAESKGSPPDIAVD